MIKAVVCVAKDFGIGKKNGLLFHITADMQHFREYTRNKIVCMGENTLLSLPGSKPLKNRTNIVLCPEGHEYNDCICEHNFNDLVEKVKNLSKSNDVIVIGGGMFYKSMLPYYDEVELTMVNAIDEEATVFFPNLDEDPNFKCVKQSNELEDGAYTFRFKTYKRIK